MRDMRRDAMRDAVEYWEGLPDHVETYWHADGSATVIHWDPAGYDCESPRTHDGNVATLINESPRTIDVDTDTAGLSEARDRLSPDMMRRYLAAYRPDILHYADAWHAGESRGWGYVTRDAWRAAMGDTDPEGYTPADAFAAEVSVYDEWARGDIYAATMLAPGAPVVIYGDHGAYVDGWRITEETVHGFYGYGDLADIARTFTGSPIVDGDEPGQTGGAA